MFSNANLLNQESYFNYIDESSTKRKLPAIKNQFKYENIWQKKKSSVSARINQLEE